MQLSKAILLFCSVYLLAGPAGALHTRRLRPRHGHRTLSGTRNIFIDEGRPSPRVLLGNNSTGMPVGPGDQGQNNKTSKMNAPTKHYANLGPGFTMSTETAIAAQSTENCKCIKAEERCIQLGFNCLEKQCVKSELQCEEIDTVCTKYVQECKETKCTEWETKCEEEISTCVEVHYDEELGTTCLRQETQCLEWAFTCSNSVCVAQSYECVKRAPPICIAFKVGCAEEHCAKQEVSCAVPEKTCLEFEKDCEP